MKFKEYSKRKIIDTPHSIERFLERNTSFSKDGVERVIYDAQYLIINQYQDKIGTYGVHSKLSGMGLIIDWREDFKINDNKNHSIVITFLPVKKVHYFNKEDIGLMVEYFNKISREGCSLKENTVDYIYRNTERGIYIIAWEGGYYDDTLSGYVIVN